jgi:hypothetical protein
MPRRSVPVGLPKADQRARMPPRPLRRRSCRSRPVCRPKLMRCRMLRRSPRNPLASRCSHPIERIRRSEVPRMSYLRGALIDLTRGGSLLNPPWGPRTRRPLSGGGPVRVRGTSTYSHPWPSERAALARSRTSTAQRAETVAGVVLTFGLTRRANPLNASGTGVQGCRRGAVREGSPFAIGQRGGGVRPITGAAAPSSCGPAFSIGKAFIAAASSCATQDPQGRS